MVVVAFIRWRLLPSSQYPTGFDGGNWLAYGHSLFGESVRSSSLVYPPVVPVLAVTAEKLFGTYRGLQVLEFLASNVPAIGTYILLYAWGLGWRAVVLSGFLATSAATGNAMAWGGYPQLIGLGLLPLLVLAEDRFLASRRLVGVIPVALLVLAALSTSDLVGPFTVLVGASYGLIRFSFHRISRTGNSLRNVAVGVILSVFALIPISPVYLALVPGIAAAQQTKPDDPNWLTHAVSSFNTVSVDLPTFWQLGFLFALLAPLAFFSRSRRLAALTTALLAPSVGLFLWSRELRVAYLVPIGIVVGLATWWNLAGRRSSWQRTLDAGIVAFLAVDLFVGTLAFASQSAYYAVLTPGLVQGFAQLEARSNPSETIAVSPTLHGVELGWWVEGVLNRRALYAGNPIWLTYADELTRNAVANRIFEVSVADSIRIARGSGAAFLFVDKKWPGYPAWEAGRTATNVVGIVFENESVLIIATS
jgi:hypothetical protein